MGCGGSKSVAVVDATSSSPGARPSDDSAQQSSGLSSHGTSPESDSPSTGRPNGIQTSNTNQQGGRSGKESNGTGESVQSSTIGDPEKLFAPPRKPQAFEIPVLESSTPDKAGEPPRRPHRLQKLESVTSPLSSDELRKKQDEVERRRKVELEKKRETGRQSTRRDRFRQQVRDAGMKYDAHACQSAAPANPGPDSGLGSASDSGSVPADTLATGLPDESADDLLVTEVEKGEGSQLWHGSENEGSTADTDQW